MRGVRVGEASNPGPVTPRRSASRILASQVDSSGIEQERTRPVEGRDVRPRRGHRRGLVVEIAPNVVDATAVDMSNSPDESDDDLELDVPADNEVVFNWIESDEEGERPLLWTQQHWVLPRKMDSGWARVWTQNPRVCVSHHQMLKTSCRCGLWQSDVFTPVKNKRISKFEHKNRLEVLVPQEICNAKPELEAFDLMMADSDTESAEARHHKTTGVFVGSWSDPGTRK